MTTKGTFYIDVFDCRVVITVSDNIKICINNVLKKISEDKTAIEYSPAGFFLRSDKNDIGTYYLFFDIESLSHKTVNHEKSHLLDYILEDREIPARDEVRSYLDGFVSLKLNNVLKKKNLEIK